MNIIIPQSFEYILALGVKFHLPIEYNLRKLLSSISFLHWRVNWNRYINYSIEGNDAKKILMDNPNLYLVKADKVNTSVII